MDARETFNSTSIEETISSSISKHPAPFQALYQTASPHVYVAACAMDSLEMDPKSLFIECTPTHKNTNSASSYPPSFRSSHFEYISPKSFGHKLPTYDRPDLPPIPEIAILGKSNVGKSSLINSLTRKRDLAKTSKTPGRTQQINYFGFFSKESIQEESMTSSSVNKRDPPSNISPSRAVAFLIDLPGYGYAEAPVDRVVKWQDTTQDFLQHRRETGVLKRLYVLVDSRHGLSYTDRAVLGWLDDAEIPYCIVLTKADRIGRPMLVRYANDICMRYHSQTFNQGYVNQAMGIPDDEDDTDHFRTTHGLQSPLLHVTSSKSGEGIHELMWTIHRDLFDPYIFTP